jgi:hypothetical protein
MSCRTRPHDRLLYTAEIRNLQERRHGPMLVASQQNQFGIVNASQFRTGIYEEWRVRLLILKSLIIEASNAADYMKAWAPHLHMAMRGSRSYTIRTDSKWGGRGPLAESSGSFPPASEREARMDDPMIRSA